MRSNKITGYCKPSSFVVFEMLEVIRRVHGALEKPCDRAWPAKIAARMPYHPALIRPRPGCARVLSPRRGRARVSTGGACFHLWHVARLAPLSPHASLEQIWAQPSLPLFATIDTPLVLHEPSPPLHARSPHPPAIQPVRRPL